jgi:hypothetical protein
MVAGPCRLYRRPARITLRWDRGFLLRHVGAEAAVVYQQSGLLALIQAAAPLDLLLARQSAHGANKLSDLASPGNRLGAVSAMLKGVPVTLRRPRR